MINIIFTTEKVEWESLRTNPDEPSTIEKTFSQKAIWVSPLPESREYNNKILVQGVVRTVEDIELIKVGLESLGKTPEIVWVGYLENGLQYNMERANIGTDEEPIYEIQFKKDEQGNNLSNPYPFNFTLYKNYLRDITEFDSEGNIINTRRPTDEEARNKQVNRYGGMPYRDLNSY